MKEILAKILGSKALSVTAITIILVLLVIVGIVKLQNSRLENKINSLEKTIDERDEDIVNLKNQIKMKDFEIHYLQKGMNIATEYETEKQKAVENESATKVEVLQTVMSNKETQGWWNTPIPDDILDLITCH